MRKLSAKIKIPDFNLLERCGKGGCSEVWRGIGQDGIQQAVRIALKDPTGYAAAEYRSVVFYRQQIGIHQNLLDFLRIGETESCYYYIMPLADHKQTTFSRYIPDTLKCRIRKQQDPVRVLPYIQAILEGVNYLHEHGISHNDLKPENILFVHGILKLIDPGLANDSSRYAGGGTPGFYPPWNATGVESDIYALGKIIYCLITGNDPFQFPEIPADADLKKLAELNWISLKCCDTDPVARYHSVAEIRYDLCRYNCGRKQSELMAEIRKARPAGFSGK